MDYAEYIAKLSFSIWQPDVERGQDRRLVVPRRAGGDAKLVELPRAPVDVLNAVVPAELDSLYETVGSLAGLPRMSTFAVGTIINRAVAAMPSGHCFVNVGTWAGFTLMAAMAGNRDSICIGVDNFSQFGGRDVFYERFNEVRGPGHEFHEMDYEDYFASVHDRPIGVYLYDGEHSYENQYRGLEMAERFFGDECIVVVDDTNRPEPYEATRDFVANSKRDYSVLFDEQTASNLHPTFWNGLLVLSSRAGKPSSDALHGRRDTPVGAGAHYDPVPVEPEAPLVSVVVRNRRSSPERLEAALADARAQRWPSLEVVVADDRPLAAAIEETHGDYVAFADAETELEPNAVRMGLAFPGRTEFHSGAGDRVYERLERSLTLSDEVSTVVPPGTSFALASGRMPVPNIDNGRTPVAFMDGATDADARPSDDDWAIGRLEQLRDAGSNFFVLGRPAFDWLDLYPGFRDHLDARAERVLESDRAVVFDLRR